MPDLPLAIPSFYQFKAVGKYFSKRPPPTMADGPRHAPLATNFEAVQRPWVSYREVERLEITKSPKVRINRAGYFPCARPQFTFFPIPLRGTHIALRETRRKMEQAG